MKIHVDDKFLVLDFEDNKEDEDNIKSFLTYKDMSAAFSRAGFDKRKIKNICFIKKMKQYYVCRSGFLMEVVKYSKENNIRITGIEDKRTKFEHNKKEWSYEELRSFFDPTFPYVEHQIRALKSLLKTNVGIVKAPTSSGKCLAKGTDVLMYDGKIKKIEDIKINDIVMGFDSTPRNVISLGRGFQKMYKIKFNKTNDFVTVNSSHVLTLKASWDLNNEYKKGDIIDIPIEEYLLKNISFKKCFKMFKVPIKCWETKEVPIEPYFLGIWLGDGRTNGVPSITSIDNEIIEYLKYYSEKLGLSLNKYQYGNKCSDFAIVGKKNNKNIIKDSLRELCLKDNKHIPFVYKTNDEKNRLELLAGLLDTDGYLGEKRYFEFVNKSEKLSYDVLFLARSLGFNATISKTKKRCVQTNTWGEYYRIYISGDIWKIPTKIKRKIAPKIDKRTDELLFGFNVEDVGVGEYFGFTLDGDGRFVLENFFVTHNTDLFIAFMKATQLPTLILFNKVSLAIQTQERIEKAGIECGIATGEGMLLRWNMVATIGSVKKIPDLAKYKVLIIDETHRASASQFQDFLDKTSYPLRFGFSATPEGNDKYDFAQIRHYMGPIISTIDVQELMENDVIVRPKITFVPCEGIKTLDWPAANEKCIMFNDKRNKIIIEKINEHNVPTLILIRNLEHGEELNRLIKDSVFLSGADDVRTRKSVVKDFEEGKIKTIIASNIFNEGISINAIRMLIIASGGKSRIETVQRLGRALRKDKGKTEAIVYDFDDYGNRFTEKHSNLRKHTYKECGFEILE